MEVRGFRRSTVKLTLKESETVLVDCLKSEDDMLAVHRCHTHRHQWVATHVPSGRAVGWFARKSSAIDFARSVVNLPWGEPDEWEGMKQRVEEALARAGSL